MEYQARQQVQHTTNELFRLYYYLLHHHLHHHNHNHHHLHHHRFFIPGEQPTRIPNLGYVSADLWAKVSYDYFCSGNATAERHGDPRKAAPDWSAAQYAFQLFGQARASFKNLPTIDVSLKPLCSWQVRLKST